MINSLLDQYFPGFKYREHQKESIVKILEAVSDPSVKYIILSAPTGSGKSHIARQVAEIYNRVVGLDALFLTKTISLQNQYEKDFPEIKKLMSASNYSCHVDYATPIPPKMKHHSGCKYTRESGLCEYASAKIEYKTSRLKLLNYAYFMAGILTYNTSGLLIADEAHNLAESILEKLACDINLKSLQRTKTDDIQLSDYLPDYQTLKKFTKDEARAVIGYLITSIDYCEALLEDLDKLIESGLDQKSLLNIIESRVDPLKAKVNRISELLFTLTHFSHDDEKNWVVSSSEEDGEIIFNLKPVFIPPVFHSQIFSEVNKVLLMSATAERIVEDLSLPSNETVFISSPYIFDISKRPVYAIQSLPSINRNTFDTVFGQYINTVDGIIDNYDSTTNILIHSVSYKNAELFKKGSKYSSRVIIPNRDQLRDIKSVAGNGNILVSPSMTEGIDLADGLAKVQIFIKLPWPFLGDDWVVAKKDVDTGWYEYVTIRTIIQGSGRGIRGPEDTADTIILDPSFKRLYDATKSKIPEWFQETINFV